ncbi:hypothetical protein LOK49_LG10G01932 [Camellia lanceoleosa]|uniref:Uncharacterized protein n=1 Tax=Camellia lanceoleosa TaxID=1840588 RepID=A0ACC0G9I6_9ERIC|nr:hypothetical protein LOK49_LG10G01932 [Camellia lanceoleosa]
MPSGIFDNTSVPHNRREQEPCEGPARTPQLPIAAAQSDLPLLPQAQKNDLRGRESSDEVSEILAAKFQLHLVQMENMLYVQVRTLKYISGRYETQTDSETGIGESFNSDSSSIRYGDSPSISNSGSSPSQSWSSRSLFEGSSHRGGNTVQATAWGLVIVTASLGGEIRAYQNFGLPVKLGRQAILFRDLS